MKESFTVVRDTGIELRTVLLMYFMDIRNNFQGNSRGLIVS